MGYLLGTVSRNVGRKVLTSSLSSWQAHVSSSRVYSRADRWKWY